MIGKELGPYRITAKIGEGGMGEVYRAQDTRLARSVAIKILPAGASADDEARERLRREARTLSQLSDPHICAIFDVGNDDGRDYLVMELLDGETLAARLARGALPMDQVLHHGLEIAGALDRAHRRGIVHRDLKPGNIMLTPAGVKLLDFGLARDMTPLFGAGQGVTQSRPIDVTAAGTVLGTLQYMAPEQLEGRVADERSDIFALGCVLHEMATGKPAFAGTSGAVVASAIMTADPPPIASPHFGTPGVDRIVRTCLAKDPERRWRSAHDVALQLTAIRDGGDAVPASARRAATSWWPWAVAAVASIAAAAAFLRPAAGAAPAAAPIRFEVRPPGGGAFFRFSETVSMSLSPDGSLLAFVADGASGVNRVWIRPMSAVEARPLDGTDGASSVFWSPDGRQVAFFAHGKLSRVDLSGGGPVSVCDVRQGIGLFGTWGRDGRILFASVQGEAIFRTSTAGETPTEIIKRDLPHDVVRVTWPVFLPDGDRFLYLARRRDSTLRLMLSEPGQEPRELLTVSSYVQYADPGFLIFVRDGALLGQRFDPVGGRIAGDPFALVNGVSYFMSTGAGHFTASRTGGVLVYQSQPNQQRVAWIDRAGKEGTIVGPSGDYLSVRFSPDGRSVVFDRSDARSGLDLWSRDLERGVEAKLTTDAGSEFDGVWLSGGSIIYSADRGGPPHLFRRDLAAAADVELLPASIGMQMPMDVSPDGRWLVHTLRTARGDFDLQLLALPGTTGAAPPGLATTATENDARFSPDGRALAFTSNESGATNVYLVPFPDMRPRIPVSIGSGAMPRWSRDGRELFFIGEGGLMSVQVRTTPSIQLDASVRLISMPPGKNWMNFDVARDGRFLAIIPEVFGAQQPMTAVVNWPMPAAR